MTFLIGIAFAFGSIFFHNTPANCKHGVHVHVIWNAPACRVTAGDHLMQGPPGSHY
jgi:hypothetical protein